MSSRRRSTLWVRIVCLGGALVWMAIVASRLPLLERFELAALDSELRLARGHGASRDIVIVAVDEKAVHRYGPLRWPPELMAQMVDILDRDGAKLIAFDFLFSGEGEKYRRPNVAQRPDLAPLRAAIQRSGKVVLGTYFDFEPDPDEPKPIPPGRDFREHRMRQIRYLGGVSLETAEPPVPSVYEVHSIAPEVAAVAHAYGHLNLIPSDDGMIRWVPLVARFLNDYYDGFSVEVARAALGDATPELLVAQHRIEGLRLGSREIKTDEQGRLLVRFAGTRGAYATVSAADVLAGHLPAEKFRGRIVLIGSTAAAGSDVWATPLDPLLPGVEIHANAIDNVLRGEFLVRNWWTRMLTFAVLGLIGLGGAIVFPLTSGIGLRRTGAVSAMVIGSAVLAHYLLFTRTGYAVSVVVPLVASVTVLGGVLTVSYFTEEKQRMQVEKTFQHYLDPTVIAELMESPERLRLGGERRELTVLFCDLRNFTTMAEGMAPEATVEMLNGFFSTMTTVVLASGGLVDKFVGDQIMAVWGAPVERTDHATRACGAALDMMEAFRRLRVGWAEPRTSAVDAKPGGGHATARPQQINCGIGVNSGPMVVGNIGSHQRFSYTVIGDNVNVASRLEALNKTYGTTILVGPLTFEAAREQFRFREIDEVQVRGRAKSQVLYELLGRMTDPAPNPDWLAAFANGLEAFRRRDWPVARSAFARACSRNPADHCARAFLAKIEELAQPHEVWEGALDIH